MDTLDLPPAERLIPFLLLYYAPVLIGAYRRRRAKARSSPPWVLFLVCMFTGWTVIGWLIALRLAFRDWEMPWENFRSGGGTFVPPGGLTPPAEPQRHRCSSCGGDGGSYCSWCQGRGRWMENTTAMNCSFCGSTGKIRCTSCSGSGWVQE